MECIYKCSAWVVAVMAWMFAAGWVEAAAHLATKPVHPFKGLEIKQQARWQRSPDCFNPQHVRGWYRDGDHLIVQMSRREGRRRLRLTLDGACHDILRRGALRFVPGGGVNRICGQVGDRLASDANMPNFGGRLPRSHLATAPCRIEAVVPLGNL